MSRRLLYSQSSAIAALDINGRSISGDQEKVRVFTDYCIKCSSVDERYVNFPDNHNTLTGSKWFLWRPFLKMSQLNTTNPAGISPKPSLAVRQRSHKLSLFYKMRNGLSPHYLTNLHELGFDLDMPCVLNITLLSHIAERTRLPSRFCPAPSFSGTVLTWI